MKILIDDVFGREQEFELSEVENVFVADDIIYFSRIPCKLSSARPEECQEHIPEELKRLIREILDIAYSRTESAFSSRYRGAWAGNKPLSNNPRFVSLIHQLLKYEN